MSSLALAGRPGLMTREPPFSISLSLAARRLPLPPPAPTTAGPRRPPASNSSVPTPCARTVRAWLSTQRLRLATFKWFSYLDLLQYPEVVCLCFFTQQVCWDIQTPPTKFDPLPASVAAFSGPLLTRGTTRKSAGASMAFRSPSPAFFVPSSLMLHPLGENKKKPKKKSKKNSWLYDETIFLLAASEWKTSGTLRIDESWTSVFLPMNTESPLVGIDSI